MSRRELMSLNRKSHTKLNPIRQMDALSLRLNRDSLQFDQCLIKS